MDDRLSSTLISDLQYALVVMEESCHLGLDDDFAHKLKCVILRRITEGESELAAHSVAPAVSWESEVCLATRSRFRSSLS